jgi:hypothetical protein
MNICSSLSYRFDFTYVFQGCLRFLGYRFDNGWRVQLDGFNLLNSRSDQITYAYGSLLKSGSLFAMCFPSQGAPTAPAAVCQTGVMDRVLHPAEPLAIRLMLAGQL